MNILSKFIDGCFKLHLLDGMNDEDYLRLVFRCKMGKKLDLEHPVTFNEKLQWLKLYYRRPEFTSYSDKYEVRKYAAEKIGEEYLIPCIGVWNGPEEIDFSSLPEQFVLKTTHDSGGVLIIKDKAAMDEEEIKKKLHKMLKRKYDMYLREWVYRDIRPRIIAEPFITDESGTELKDYKFFCFNGKVKAMFIASGRQGDFRKDFFDENFNHLPLIRRHPNADITPAKPENFEEMKRLASILSEGIPHVRVDFYNVRGKIYFGEMTFFSNGGMGKFEPEEWDTIFGSWLELPKQK